MMYPFFLEYVTFIFLFAAVNIIVSVFLKSGVSLLVMVLIIISV